MRLGDLNWRLAPLVSFLYAFGGWNFSSVRRMGIPIAVLFFTFAYYNVKKTLYLYLYPVLAIAVFAVFRLPITLIGDGIPGHWQNWLWLWALGGVQAASLLPLAFFSKDRVLRWLVCLMIHTFVTGFLLTLSNTWGYPTHAWVEAGIGMSYGGCAAWLINEN